MSFISHFDQEHFVSCEDQLPKLHGFHNFACSVSGLIILLLQIHPVAMMMKSHRNMLDMDAVLYLVSLVFLFYLNLQQHITGYAPIDLDSGGGLHSIFLSLWLNNSLGSKAHVSCNTARVIGYASAMIFIATSMFYPNKQEIVFQILSPPFALYTIITMGIRSYRYRNDNKRNAAWRKWCTAVAALLAVQLLVKVEEMFICDDTIIARLFHAIIIHAVIQILFQAVSTCAIAIIAYEQGRSRNEKES
mmetsp:Transcript_16183/g.23793  ORF Transcript_16183/g.23793 Transcript_16183/m.23793 type:complete len:247 (+) Transcript_16183:76-816(+)